MDKFSLSKSSVNSANSVLINFLAAILILLFSFNLGWLIMFVRFSSRLSVVRNLTRTIFNFESFLLLGNLGIFLLFITYALGLKNLRQILGTRA